MPPLVDAQQRQITPEPAERTSPGVASEGETLVHLRASLAQAVNSLCPASLRAHSEDIVQQAMLKVMRIISTRSEADAPLPASYLWRVAYTTCIDELRKMRSRAHTRDQAASIGAAAPAAAPSPERAAAGREVGEAIRDCVTRLAESRRRAVSLYLQGHSVPEAGELLGWTRKKTENLVFRGLADLRRCLSGKGVRP